ncbi:MAG: leucine--tRNA ligase [Alphaproteobacteria bacterium]|nr:leucine--tRNA ligase [Alphaproteobacteria bacterium]
MSYSKTTDQKWQKKWVETNLYKYDENAKGEKLYCLEMFSYPSGASLHCGHWYNFAPIDSWARFKKMQGYNVFHPMGFDAFGLPAENYAIKTGIHPKDSTLKNIEIMTNQLIAMGANYDWNYSLNTCDEEYYKWTQWIFIQLYKKGLAYQKEAPVNWCPSCQTVLANEQVKEGHCDRCDSLVVQKNMKQWFFKITDYADELLEKIDGLNWPEKTKKIQKNWIGKSHGSLITFDIDNGTQLKAFTTRADTLYGLSYVVIAPEHPAVASLTKPEQKEAVEKYVADAAKVKEIDRLSTERERTGVFTGSYATNPVDGRKVPVWVADYVIASYGTGFVMAVPAHDERDYDFAKRYDLPITRVIVDKDGNEQPLPFCDHGKLVDSQEFSGMTTEEAIPAIVAKLAKDGKGELTTMFRLRDWLISRQRYWGAPIPMIHCPHCGTVPVPESDLPVKLPYDVEFRPDGESPLKRCPEFMHVKCPVCGADAERDPDTMDTFVDSSWYFLRYPDARNDKEVFNKDKINRMCPIDMYVGGQEHATMHLLYARFFTKALRDMGYLNFDEPFTALVHQGMILGPDGQKMSKSKGNTVNPDTYVDKYGADVVRLFFEFAFSYTDGGPWSDAGIESMSRYVKRVETFFEKAATLADAGNEMGKREKDLDFARNSTIKAITKDLDAMQFNTSLARMMGYLNALNEYAQGPVNKTFLNECLKTYVILLAPFAPHLCEELWEAMGGSYSVHNQPWPTVNEDALVKSDMIIVVQVNGKLRGQFEIAKSADKDTIIAKAKEIVPTYLDGKEIIKEIYVPNKLVNIVIKG